MKAKKSKLDGYAAQLDDWFGVHKHSLEQVQGFLKKDGCSVSTGRLSEWWAAQQQQKMQDLVLGQIASGSAANQKVVKAFGKNPPPELETLIKLLRVLILQLSQQAAIDPGMLELVATVMKPVLKHAEIMERKAGRELDEKKFIAQERTKIKAGLDQLAVEFAKHPEAMELHRRAVALLEDPKK